MTWLKNIVRTLYMKWRFDIRASGRIVPEGHKEVAVNGLLHMTAVPWKGELWIDDNDGGVAYSLSRDQEIDVVYSTDFGQTRISIIHHAVKSPAMA